jgi:uncharacterized membrane protein YhaH (DUF805 family)
MPAPIAAQRVPIEHEAGGGAAPPQSFVGAISTCLTKYAVFSGRASRSEYWFFWLFGLTMNWGSLFVFSAILPFELAQTLWGLVSLALILPLLAAAVRRMHDVGKSGFFVLVPLYNLVLLVSPGTDGPNRFG